MPMNPRLLRPLASGFLTDADAIAYVAAVEAADGQKLEKGVALAYESFITGCKADGIWDAIKSSCILAGARTLAGALVPLVGAAPTNNGPFVSGDYSRTAGLKGNGSTKYLNTNRNNNADPQNSNHNAVYVTEGPTINAIRVYIGSNGIGTSGANNLYSSSSTGIVSGTSRTTVNQATAGSGNQSGAVGIIGHYRNTSNSQTLRVDGQEYTSGNTSQTPSNENVLVYARTADSPALHSDARLAFYSIGEAIDLAALDTRVGNLITALGAAIP